jgi:hypothetical protein
MKGLSFLLTVSLFVFAAALAQRLQQKGLLPAQISSDQGPQARRTVPVNFVKYHTNNPHHLN